MKKLITPEDAEGFRHSLAQATAGSLIWQLTAIRGETMSAEQLQQMAIKLRLVDRLKNTEKPRTSLEKILGL